MRRVTSEAAFRKSPSSPALDLDAFDDVHGSPQAATKHFLLFLLDAFTRSVVPCDTDPRPTFEMFCKALNRARVLDSVAFLSDYARYHRLYLAPCGSFLTSLLNGATAVVADDIFGSERSGGSSAPLTPRAAGLQSSTRRMPLLQQQYASEPPLSRFAVEWEDLGPVGSGGYGAVHRARHRLDAAVYAVKKIRLRSAQVPERVLREVKALARLSHPHIIRYHTAWLEVQEATAPPAPPSPSPEHELDHFQLPATAFALSPHERFVRALPRVASMDGPLTDGGADSSQVLTPTATEFDSEHDGDVATRSTTANVTLYIAMELCECTLQDWLERNGRTVHPAENNALLAQLLRALHYLHSLGIVHRDVKPSNCFLKSNGQGQLTLRLGDFGLARDGSTTPAGSSSPIIAALLPSPAPPPLPSAPSVVLPDSPLPSSSGPHSGRLGTRLYAAPEQEIVPPAPYTPAADVYAVGIMLVELYTPFNTRMERSKTLSALRHQSLPVPFLARYPREAALSAVLLALDPLRRPSAADALRILEEATTMLPPPAPLQLLRAIDRNRLASSTPD